MPDGVAKTAINHSPSEWGRYLEGQSLEGFLDFLAYHGPFVSAVVEGRPRTSIEIGCGGANLSIFLSLLGVTSTGLDLESDVLREAQRHATGLNAKIQLLKGDAFATPFRSGQFDVAFSQGLLEHFPDEEIILQLRECQRIARRVVVSIPNKNYPRRDFGNERLLSRDAWHGLAETALAPGYSVRTSDYRRRLHIRHPWNTFLNQVLRRAYFTLIIIEKEI